MSFTDDEIERLAEETADGRILESLYCGWCGYNLRHCAVKGACPECGRDYWARRGAMRGIHRVGDVTFPSGDVAWAAFCLLLGYLILRKAFAPANDWLIMIGGVFAVGGLYLAWHAYREIWAYIRYARIEAKIREESDAF